MTCSKCGQDQPLAPRRKHCKVCEAAYQKAYREANKADLKAKAGVYLLKRRDNQNFVESERKRGREYWRKLRQEVIDAYGGPKCACCGETEERFLSIDHIFNDGASHRREIGSKDGNGKGASSATLQWLKRHDFPAGFQVLCMNCNFGKQTNGGVCPHKSRSVENGVNSGKVQNG